MNRALATIVYVLAVGIGCGGHGGTKKSAVDSGGADSATTKGDAAKADATAAGDVCPAFTACGGDIVGTWHVNPSCTRGQASGWCAEFISEDWSGTQMDYTFASDGAFTVSSSGTFRATFREPFWCLSAADAGAAQMCADLGDTTKATVEAKPLPGIAAAAFSCSADSTGCVCDQVYTLIPSTKTGTYATRNAELVVSFATDAAAPDTGPSEYCVSGNTLAVHSYDSNGYAGTSWFVKN
jgi:hypothetical protein